MPLADPGMHRAMATTDDGALAVATAGHGRTLLMLHGWTLDHRCWHPQLPLADHTRLVMPDRRGFGRSTAPPGLAREWRDLDRLAGAAPFVLAGLSQGASVALDFARRRGERLAGLVLIGAPLHDVVPDDEQSETLPRDHYAALVRGGALAAMKRAWAAHPLTRTSPVARPAVEAMLADYDGRDLLPDPEPVAITRDDIAALSMPVLALAGADDSGWRRRVAAFIGSTAPSGRTVLIDGAGHLCNLDQPSLFNRLLGDFIAGLPN